MLGFIQNDGPCIFFATTLGCHTRFHTARGNIIVDIAGLGVAFGVHDERFNFLETTQNLPRIYLGFTLYFLGAPQDEKRGAYQNSGADKKGKGEGFVEKYHTGPNPKGNR